jgi:uncharacterized protein (DUF362 family)
MRFLNSSKVITALIFVLVLFPLPGCKKQNANPFPATGEVNCWQKTGDTRVFAAKNLWQYIDGDSEQYVNAGVVSTSTADYKYESRLEAVVDVHTMGNAEGARSRRPLRATRRCRRCLCAKHHLSQRRIPGPHRGLSVLQRRPPGLDGSRPRRGIETLTTLVILSAAKDPLLLLLIVRNIMESRREFLKEAAGAALLAAQGSTVLARAIEPGPGQSRVVVARDPAAHSADGKLDEGRVIALLDRAITAYTGSPTPADAWKRVVAMAGGPGKVIGLKTNGLGGRGISTHSALVFAIAHKLEEAGVNSGNIVIWDRNARDLVACGFTVSTDPARLRCYGSDVAGFEDEDAAWGTARVRLSKILTRECAMVIGVPILKDHSMAGVTFAMKNMYGVVERPQELHSGGCNPGVADLNCIPAIREKVRLTIGDALSSVYDGGPGFRPERLWYPNALILGEDRVAVDHTAWQILERKRAEAGLNTFEAAGRPPRYIATAADPTHALGTNDPTKIRLLEV